MTASGEYEAGVQAGWNAANGAALTERNRLAHVCAQANADLALERSEHAETRELLSIRDDDLDALRNEFERVTGRDWTAEKAREWFG